VIKNQIGVAAKTKYGIAQEIFIAKTMVELGCGRRKANGKWMKSQERFNIVFEHELKKDTSKQTPFESNYLDSDDVGSPC
jgi:hypothetical protein